MAVKKKTLATITAIIVIKGRRKQNLKIGRTTANNQTGEAETRKESLSALAEMQRCNLDVAPSA